MATIIEITDLAAPELALYSHLTEHQLRSRLEPEKGICIVETPKVIGTALENGLQPVSFLMERKRITGLGKPFVDTCDVPVYTGDRERLAALTGYTLTRGVLCAMKRPVLPAAETILQDARLVCVLSGVVDSTNIGAIFRSAAALGVDAVLVMDDCCDPLCRRAIRVSMGTVFQIPWTWISSLDVVRKGGFRTAALALHDRSVWLDDPVLQEEEKLAVVFGSEGYGLPDETIQACDYVVKIPMYHGVDSLNVAAASAVTFWQLRR